MDSERVVIPPGRATPVRHHLELNDGVIVTGVVKGEDGKQVKLMTPEGNLLAIPKANINARRRGPSAMPADLVKRLTKSELRDLVEFLASLK
jgi:quinoprotein glucose dehydrogenase